MGAHIYQKTLTGVHEIDHRSQTVSGKLRRILIMIDGRKDVDQLRKTVMMDDIEEALHQLLDMRMIEPHKISMADLIDGAIH